MLMEIRGPSAVRGESGDSWKWYWLLGAVFDGEVGHPRRVTLAALDGQTGPRWDAVRSR